MNKRKKFSPVPGKIYENAGGGYYRCITILGNGIALMQNTISKGACIAHGCGIYEDGRIDWDRSSDGRFEEDDLA